MPKKTKPATTKRNLQRKKAISAEVKKLELQLKKLQKNLEMFRFFCD